MKVKMRAYQKKKEKLEKRRREGQIEEGAKILPLEEAKESN